jgi:hypothetical protein
MQSPRQLEGVSPSDYVAALGSAAFKASSTSSEATGIDATENYYACCAYDMMVVVALRPKSPPTKARRTHAHRRHRRRPCTTSRRAKLLKEGKKIPGRLRPIDFDRSATSPLFKLEIKNGKVTLIGRTRGYWRFRRARADARMNTCVLRQPGSQRPGRGPADPWSGVGVAASHAPPATS